MSEYIQNTAQEMNPTTQTAGLIQPTTDTEIPHTEETTMEHVQLATDDESQRKEEAQADHMVATATKQVDEKKVIVTSDEKTVKNTKPRYSCKLAFIAYLAVLVQLNPEAIVSMKRKDLQSLASKFQNDEVFVGMLHDYLKELGFEKALKTDLAFPGLQMRPMNKTALRSAMTKHLKSQGKSFTDIGWSTKKTKACKSQSVMTVGRDSDSLIRFLSSPTLSMETGESHKSTAA